MRPGCSAGPFYPRHKNAGKILRNGFGHGIGRIAVFHQAPYLDCAFEPDALILHDRARIQAGSLFRGRSHMQRQKRPIERLGQRSSRRRRRCRRIVALHSQQHRPARSRPVWTCVPVCRYRQYRARRQSHQAFGDGPHHDGADAFHPLGANHDQPGLVLPGNIHQHLGHRALPHLGMAVNPFAQQFAGQLVQHLARRFRHVTQHAAGNRIHRGILHWIQAVCQHNPRSVVGRQLARVLEGRLCVASQVRRDHNGRQAVFKAHHCLPAAAVTCIGV